MTNTDLNNTTHYQIDYGRFNQHLVDVTVSFVADSAAPTLWLPAWIPGSYLMREFARNITAVHYQLADNHQLTNNSNQLTNNSNQLAESSEIFRAQKLSKNEWQLPNVSAGDAVKVSYEVAGTCRRCRRGGPRWGTAQHAGGQERQSWSGQPIGALRSR